MAFVHEDSPRTTLPNPSLGSGILAQTVSGGVATAYTEQTYASQISWYVDPANGSDGAAGTQAAPVQSLSEVARRLRGTVMLSAGVPQVATIHILSDLSATDLLLDLPALADRVDITGTETLVANSASTTTAVTLTNKTAGQDAQLTIENTALGADGFTPYLGKMIRFYSAGVVAARAFVLKAIAGKKAMLSEPRKPGGDGVTAFTVTQGMSYDIVTLPKITVQTSAHGWLRVTSCEIGGVTMPSSYGAVIAAPGFLEVRDSLVTADGTIEAGRMYAYNAHFLTGYAPFFVGRYFLFTGCSARSLSAHAAMYFSNTTWAEFAESTVLEATQLLFGWGSSGRVQGSLGVFDVTDNTATDRLLYLRDGAYVRLSGLLWGAGNACPGIGLHSSFCRLGVGTTPQAQTTNATKVDVHGTAKTYAEAAAGYWDSVHQCGTAVD